MDLTLDVAVRGFLLSCEAENLSDNTVAWYKNNLSRFLAWLRAVRTEANGQGAIPVASVTVGEVRSYLAWLQTPHLLHPKHKIKRKAKPNTVRGYWATLSVFFGWCVREGFLEESPVARVRAPKIEVPEIDILNRDEMRRVLRTCNSKRDEALLRFLLDTLCRVMEAAELHMDNLDLARGRGKVLGKGARERFVYFGRATRKALWLYIELERPEPLPGTENNLVFLRHDGVPRDSKAMTKHIRALGARAGVPRLHAHLLRHTGAIERLRNGQDVFTLQRLLGHSTLEMVRRYLRALKNEDAEVASAATSPGDRWRL